MSMNESSRVAVLMPAYNAERFINRAVDSLMRGSYPCDLYVVDDGSNIPVARILGDIPRTHIIRLERNGGVAAARNAGLRAILARQYDFVACHDADDISYPDRIAKQVEFLDRHSEIAAVGVWGRHFDEVTGKPTMIQRTPSSAAQTKKMMHVNMAIINSSAMIRVSALRAVGLYSELYPAAEDYELFRRISREFQIANIPSVLMDICISPTGISLHFRRRQLLDRFKIQLRYFEPAALRAWLGLGWTAALLALPQPMARKFKRWWKRDGHEGMAIDPKVMGSVIILAAFMGSLYD